PCLPRSWAFTTCVTHFTLMSCISPGHGVTPAQPNRFDSGANGCATHRSVVATPRRVSTTATTVAREKGRAHRARRARETHARLPWRMNPVAPSLAAVVAVVTPYKWPVTNCPITTATYSTTKRPAPTNRSQTRRHKPETPLRVS